MITAIIIISIVIILGAVFGLAFSLTGAIFAALLWIIKLPIALVIWIIGALCYCTIILIPAGMSLFHAGCAILAV